MIQSEKEAREIVDRHPSSCQGIDCIEARAYLACLTGPEFKAKEKEIAELMANRVNFDEAVAQFRKWKKDYFAKLQVERERSKPLIAMLKFCRSVAAELNITKGGKRLDILIDDVISAHEEAGKL